MATFQSLPGFREFYPEDFSRRNHLFRLWRQTATTFGFAEYDAPVLEPLDLYKAKSGDEIEAQLFSFTDKGGREVAERMEGAYLPDFYGAYLDERLVKGRKELRP